jgi:hypothetical protein
VERVWGNARHRLDGGLQLVVVYVEDDIRLPLLAHIGRVPQGTEPHSQRFKWLGLWESGTLQHLPCYEGDQYEKPTEMELIPLVLHFPTIQFELIHQVLRPIHLKSFCALPYEINYESSHLGGSVLAN